LHCREPFTPDDALIASLGIDTAALEASQFFRATGCVACHGTGYSGRIALFDFLPVDDAIARLILKRADAREIEECACAAGQRTLLQEGYAKAAQGLTTIEEVLRVASGE
jgi:general secretion pathway protein E